MPTSSFCGRTHWRETGQLKTVLFHSPPYFIPHQIASTRAVIRAWLPRATAICLEFRKIKSWYPAYHAPVISRFCRQERFTLTAADEPHQTEASALFYPAAVTTPDLMFWRLHGRKSNKAGSKGPNWRKERTFIATITLNLNSSLYPRSACK